MANQESAIASDTRNCDGERCDGRMEVDPFCSLHGDRGRRFYDLERQNQAAEWFAAADPDVDWPSGAHDSAASAIMAALDTIREAQV